MKRFLCYALLAVILPLLAATAGTLIALRVAHLIPKSSGALPVASPVEPPDGIPHFGVRECRIPPGDRWSSGDGATPPPFDSKRLIYWHTFVGDARWLLRFEKDDTVYIMRAKTPEETK
jgi:hypothetical protein